MALPVIIDCDPGHDDAIALVLALASPELNVKAVTSSAGNQTPDKTLRNVLRMLTLLKRPDIPVAGGALKPLMRELIIADNVHGESGLDGPALPEPGFAAQTCTAVAADGQNPARQRRAGHHRRNRPANQRRPAAQQPP